MAHTTAFRYLPSYLPSSLRHPFLHLPSFTFLPVFLPSFAVLPPLLPSFLYYTYDFFPSFTQDTRERVEGSAGGGRIARPSRVAGVSLFALDAGVQQRTRAGRPRASWTWGGPPFSQPIRQYVSPPFLCSFLDLLSFLWWPFLPSPSVLHIHTMLFFLPTIGPSSLLPTIVPSFLPLFLPSFLQVQHLLKLLEMDTHTL